MVPSPSGTLADSIIADTADALIFADVEGVIRVWNAAATTLFGFTADEAIGTSLDLIIPERLRAAHWAGYRRAIASGTTRLAGRPTTTRGLHRSGARLYVEMSFAVVRDAGGAVLGSVAMARDVTAAYEKARAAQPAPG